MLNYKTFLIIIVNEIIIHNVLKTIKVGRDFLILDQIKRDDVKRVKKCNHHISLPKTNPGTMIAALAIQAVNSIVL
jgi:hypothetical protein